MEAANRDIEDLAREREKGNRTLGSVNRVNDVHTKMQQDTRTCYRCNRDNHIAKDCRFAKERSVITAGKWGTSGFHNQFLPS